MIWKYATKLNKGIKTFIPKKIKHQEKNHAHFVGNLVHFIHQNYKVRSNYNYLKIKKVKNLLITKLFCSIKFKYYKTSSSFRYGNHAWHQYGRKFSYTLVHK